MRRRSDARVEIVQLAAGAAAGLVNRVVARWREIDDGTEISRLCPDCGDLDHELLRRLEALADFVDPPER